MKRIIDYTLLNGTQSVKLRLRGKGSGYKEGLKNAESDDPLQLCISSMFYEKYNDACTMAQELLMNIFEEYKRYCQKSGKDLIKNLRIQKMESQSHKKM